MDYVRFELREELTVRSLISFMYRELSNTYRSAGERHDFWEFAYVDKGEAEVWIESNPYELKQGSIVFYRPNEFHRLVRVSTPNLFIVAFDCSSPALNQFKGRCFRLDDEERAIIARMLQAGINVFGAPLNKPSLTRRNNAPFGSEQLVKMELEALLIRLIQKLSTTKKSESTLSSVSSQNRDDVLMEQIIRYLSAHLSHNLTVEQVCAQFTLSRSMLTRLFRKSTNSSFIEYLMQMRITEAKRMIREHSYNFTEIGERLGYTSVHYFSKQFKQITGMTPTEYSRSVNALIQDAAAERK